MADLPIITVDYETDRIAPRPVYPPKPVGVALEFPGKPSEYLAWGHPMGNNISRADARRRLHALWKQAKRREVQLLFHNAKFDIDVGETHLDLPRLDWRSVNDTMFLAFLDNPDRSTLSLKPLAEEVLRKKPTERDALREWIIANVPEAKRKPSEWGAYICRAPGELVGRYARGDVVRTRGVYKKLMPAVQRHGMQRAYDLERRILHPLLDSERLGMRVDMKRLKAELPFYEAMLERADEIIREMLNAPHLDIDKKGGLGQALDDAGAITEWVLTAKGNRSMNKKALLGSLTDKKLLAILFYRNALATSIRTFMRPWLATCLETGGWIHTTWNQVRSDYHGSVGGARTGRLSSTPNFQNIPLYTRSVLILPRLKEAGLDKKIINAKLARRFPWVTKQISLLPMMKDYILPDLPGGIIIERDYSQQELRILAHYEDDQLAAAYRNDPHLDMHNHVGDLIHQMYGVRYERRPIKDLGFSLIYGMGLGTLAQKMEKTVDEVKELKGAYLKAIPGIKMLDRELKTRARANQPITTWGGRRYFVEKPVVKDGRIRTFEYKLINRLIQGSAADCTKESIARFHEHPDVPKPERGAMRFMITVHDSNEATSPKRDWKKCDRILKESMESVEFDVPMKSDGKWGTTLHQLQDIKD